MYLSERCEGLVSWADEWARDPLVCIEGRSGPEVLASASMPDGFGVVSRSGVMWP